MKLGITLALAVVACVAGARDINLASRSPSHSRSLRACVGISCIGIPSVPSIPIPNIPISNPFVHPVPQRPTPAAPVYTPPKAPSASGTKPVTAVISRAPPGEGNVNCASGNFNSCRNAPGAQTGRGSQYNGGRGDNGDGKFDVVNSNNCDPRTHHACCHHKNGQWSDTTTVCDGSAECCSGPAG